MDIIVVLHNIRSAHNVGSIFRTADGARVSKIILSGYTPTPIDRFGRVHPELEKTSLGATHTVPYECVSDIEKHLTNLKQEKYSVVAVEQVHGAVAYAEYCAPERVVFIFGNEITGVEPELLAHADTAIHIPMYGSKESLNVSVCAGIILFHARTHFKTSS